jgi:hypothetical protein
MVDGYGDGDSVAGSDGAGAGEEGGVAIGFGEGRKQSGRDEAVSQAVTLEWAEQPISVECQSVGPPADWGGLKPIPSSLRFFSTSYGQRADSY